MADPPFDDSMCILARELLGIGTGVRVWRTIGITLHGDSGHGDYGSLGQPLFKIVILRFTFSQPDPPAVIMDHDVDMIRIIEGRGAAIECCIIEVPFRRSEPPDKLVELVPVFFISG